MFYDCRSIVDVPVGLFVNNPEPENISHLFSACQSLVTIPVNLFAYNPKLKNASAAFYSCTSLTHAPTFYFNREVEDFGALFEPEFGIRSYKKMQK